jgi:hypothetical protein
LPVDNLVSRGVSRIVKRPSRSTSRPAEVAPGLRIHLRVERADGVCNGGAKPR